EKSVRLWSQAGQSDSVDAALTRYRLGKAQLMTGSEVGLETLSQAFRQLQQHNLWQKSAECMRTSAEARMKRNQFNNAILDLARENTSLLKLDESFHSKELRDFYLLDLAVNEWKLGKTIA